MFGDEPDKLVPTDDHTTPPKRPNTRYWCYSCGQYKAIYEGQECMDCRLAGREHMGEDY